MEQSQTTTTQSSEGQGSAPLPTKSATFNFRVLKFGTEKFDKAIAEFDTSQTPYTTEYNDDKSAVISIKRSAVKVDLPVYSPATYSEAFVAILIQDQVIDAVRKEFIDNNKVVNLSLITPEWVEQALATKRAAAVPVEAITAFAKLMEQLLEAGGTKEGTIKVIVELIKGRFGKRVLKNFSQLREQFVGVAQKIESSLATQDAETVTEHMPVLELIADNLDKYMSADEEEVIDLDLS